MLILNKFLTLFKSRFIRDSFNQLSTNVMTAVISFVVLPLLVKIFGSEGFGEIVLIQSIALIVSSFSIIQYSKTILITVPSSSINVNLLVYLTNKGFFSEIYSIPIFIALLLCIESFNVFPISSNLALLIFAGVFAITTPCSTFANAYRTLGKLKTYLFITLLANLLRLVITLFYLYHIDENKTVIAFFIFIAPELIKYALLVYFYPYRFLNVKLSTHLNYNNTSLKKLSFLGSIQNWVDLPSTQFDKVILSQFLSIELVGTYHILRRLGFVITYIFTPFTSSLNFYYSKFINDNNILDAFKACLKSIPAFLVLSFTLALLMLFTKAYWFDFVFNNVTLYNNEILFALLTYTVQATMLPINPLVNSLKLQKQSILATATGNIIFFTIAIITTPIWGISGLFIGLLIQYVIDYTIKFISIIKYKNER